MQGRSPAQVVNADEVPRPRAAVVLDPDPPAWGWALVEIRSDGSCGAPQMIPAPGTVDPPRADTLPSVSSSLAALSELLKGHLAATRVEVAAVLARGATAATEEERSRFLGPLAHVEALQGDLRRAEHHARQVMSTPPDPLVASSREHALLAEGWVALERGDFHRAQLRLDVLDDVVHEHDAWLTTSHVLLDGKLSIATGEPETAIRLLAVRQAVAAAAGAAGAKDWLADLVTVTRAEALIASGEPQRAMAMLTPLPQHAVVEALVMSALARRRSGDIRGAMAVLSRAATDLDQAPLSVQIEAWVLEARMAKDQGRPERAKLLTDRALRAAASEGMRRAVMKDWQWLRWTVERDPNLLKRHRGFLATPLEDAHGTWRPGPVTPNQGPTPAGDRAMGDAQPDQPDDSPSDPCPLLTTRESEVLELLAEMNSTMEIADALFVSTNTVKTHLKGIFNKLGVNRRVDAVRRGRQLGLC